MRPLRVWGEMIKFSHSVFALPFALVAAFLAGRHLAGGVPGWGRLGLIVLCMVAARSFAMTFNRIADAAIDARNPRTEGRPLPTGRITLRQAWAFLVAAVAVFVCACAGFRWAYGNDWPLLLATPTLALLAGYSYAKLFTRLAHFVLGTAIGLAPAAAWIAIHPTSVGWTALTLCGTVLFWIAGFDIIYACQDVEIDRREGLRSVPASVGVGRALILSRACHLATVVLLVVVGRMEGLGGWYWAAVVLAGILLAVEQSLVRANDLSKVNIAFFTMNGIVSLLVGGLAILDIVLGGDVR